LADLMKEMDALQHKLEKVGSALDRRVMANKKGLLDQKQEYKAYFKAFEKRMNNRLEHTTRRIGKLNDAVKKLQEEIKELKKK
jgi:predicted  nucleic acid-binding Zn-ribbon protein